MKSVKSEIMMLFDFVVLGKLFLDKKMVCVKIPP